MRARLAGAVGILAVALLAGCGGGGGASSTATGGAASSSSVSAGSSAAGSGTSASSSTATQVKVSATEYKLALDTTSFAPGTYTFVMTDDGSASHALAMEGPGVSNAKSATVGPGGTASLTVTFQKGQYTLYCPVANHRALGMETTLTIG